MTHVKTLRALCSKDKRIKLVERNNGHFQLHGPLLVNYYPNSKNRTAYIAGTKKSLTNITPEKAVSMCFHAPSLGKTKRKNRSAKKIRFHLLKKIQHCHWCGTELTLDTSTLEHIIPLACGGLDNANNRTLACGPCNNSRGSSMPELKHSGKNG